jgi:methenyltetrahydromethanopterin cyclohydrolase
MTTELPPSVNARAQALIDALVAAKVEYKIEVSRGVRGETLIDSGSRTQGSIEAGLALADICMGGLGSLQLTSSSMTPRWPWTLLVHSSNPVAACLASQYAGWRLSYGEGKDAFFALGSGPARALARIEPLFETLDYRDPAKSAALVLESSRAPPPEIVDQVVKACDVAPERLTILYAPTQSLAGSTQIVARVLEVALHKAHELKFPLGRIVEGMGAAPLAPPHPDLVTAMGRTNDAIIYGGQVHLFVSGAAGDAKSLAERLPSRQSRDYGRSFAELFASVNGDFYAIDPMLFSPAMVIVTAIETGQSFRAGELNFGLLDASFA